MRNVEEDDSNNNIEEEDVVVNSLKVSVSFAVERVSRVTSLSSTLLHQQQQEILMLRTKNELLERELNKVKDKNKAL